MIRYNVNACDQICNELQIHFTKSCPNKCPFCIDATNRGLDNCSREPDVQAIYKRILYYEDKKELLALSEVLILRADHSTPSEIERYIKMFYPEEILSRLKENWLCDSPLDRLVSGISAINESYDYEKINELRLRLKKVFTENRILQDDLKKLFNR